MRSGQRKALGAAICVLLVAALPAAAGAHPGGKRDGNGAGKGRAADSADGSGAAQNGPDPRDADFEAVTYIDRARPFHGGPPPHEASDEADDFRLSTGGLHWFDAPKTVTYSVSQAGCVGDCDEAVGAANAGFDAWEVSGLTFTQEDATPDENPCTGAGNAVTWGPFDGMGGVLAVASVCHNVATKEIAGFDVTFDSAEMWSDSGGEAAFDIQATAAHEAGHVTGPDHVNPPRAARLTMYTTGSPGDTGTRTLGCGDRLAVNALYGTSLDCTGLPGD